VTIGVCDGFAEGVTYGVAVGVAVDVCDRLAEGIALGVTAGLYDGVGPRNPPARCALAVCVGEVPARGGKSVGARSVCVRVGISALQLHRRESRLGLAFVVTVGGRPRRMEGICRREARRLCPSGSCLARGGNPKAR
jgi:hypothetical protein